MEARALLAALKRRREKSVDLGEGRAVTFLRPLESDMGSMLSGEGAERTWSVTIEHVKKFVNGWSGFTEADLLGASIGSSDPVSFDPDLWAEVCADDIETVQKVAQAILKSVIDHLSEQADVAKNSEPA